MKYKVPLSEENDELATLILDAWLETRYKSGVMEFMDTLNIIVKSRKQSIDKLKAAIASLEDVCAKSQTAAKDVLRNEINVKQARLVRLIGEVKALESEIERLNPSLPGMGKGKG